MRSSCVHSIWSNPTVLLVSDHVGHMDCGFGANDRNGGQHITIFLSFDGGIQRKLNVSDFKSNKGLIDETDNEILPVVSIDRMHKCHLIGDGCTGVSFLNFIAQARHPDG